MSNNKINKRSLSVPIFQLNSETESDLLLKTKQFQLNMIKYTMSIDRLMDDYLKELETFINSRDKDYNDDVDDSDSNDSNKQEFRRRKSRKTIKRNIHSYNNEQFLVD